MAAWVDLAEEFEKKMAVWEAARERRKAYLKAYRKRHREHRRAAKRAWYERNREHYQAANKAWNERNPGRHRAAVRNWKEQNSERYRAANKAWKEQNPERYRALGKARRHRRRCRLKEAGGSFTASEWLALQKKYGNRCLCCGELGKLTPDHVIPVAKGGSGDISNIQPLCLPCNRKKGTKVIDYRKAE